MKHQLDKILFHVLIKFKGKKSQKKSTYLSSQKFLEDMRRAAEKGAEEQTRIMQEAGMQWSNES